MQLVYRFIRSINGATGAEYAIMIGVIALAIILGATAIGKNVNTQVQSPVSTIG